MGACVLLESVAGPPALWVWMSGHRAFAPEWDSGIALLFKLLVGFDVLCCENVFVRFYPVNYMAMLETNCELQCRHVLHA